MEIYQLGDLHPRLELENSKNGSPLQKLNISYHGNPPLSQLTNSTAKASRIQLNSNNLVSLAPTKRSKSIPWNQLTEMLYAFGKVTDVFRHFPNDGEAIITHWLHSPEDLPIGLSAE